MRDEEVLKMIPVPFLIAAGLVALIGGAVVVANWDDVLNWLHDFLPKVSKLVRELAKQCGPDFEHIANMFADLVDDAHAKIEHVLYHKRMDGKWEEEITRRILPESELPPHIKQKILAKRRQREKADITNEMEEMVGMTIG